MELTIYFDVAAVILCVMLIISLNLRKLTKGRTNRIFLVLSGLICLSGVLDIVTELYGPVFETNKYTVVDQAILNYLYFYVRNFNTPFYIVYITSVMCVWQKLRKTKWFMPCLIVPYSIDVLFLLSNPWTKFVFYFDENGMYHRGSLIIVLYMVAFFYMAFAFVEIITNGKVLHWKKVVVLCVFLPLGALSVVLQMVNPSWRFEIMMTTFMTVVVAITVQCPDENLDKLVNAQSYNAFLLDVDKVFASNWNIVVVLIKCTNHTVLRGNLGIELYTKLMRAISEKIQRIQKVMGLSSEFYYIDRGTFALISDIRNEEKIIDAGRLISAYLSEPIKLEDLEINVLAKTVLVNVPIDLDSKHKFIDFAHTFSYKMPTDDDFMILGNFSNQKEYKIRMNMDEIISKAIEKKKFKMYYQPIYSVKEQRFVSAEALIRLFDDEYGFISPGLFIPAAEQSGAIHAIGDFVFEDVCKFIYNNRIRDYGLDYIEVNLSVAQCIEPDLARKVMDIINKFGLPTNLLNIEITETAVDYDNDLTNENIEILSRLGFKFSLDDYGTGYSNNKRLVQMPMDLVKLDKSFVDEIADENMVVVLERTIAMLKKLNKKILIEGVETKEMLDKFVELGCDYIQGFYYSKPLPEDEFIRFIDSYNNQIKINNSVTE